MDTIAILVAGGRGERMGAERPKAFLLLGGQPLLLKAALAFEAAASVTAIVVVAPAAEIATAREVLARIGKLRDVVAGGPRRQDSVLEGLKQVPDGFDGVVLVHDAARPLVDPALIDTVARAAGASGAAIPVLALPDTIKKMRDGKVQETVERSELTAAQTPQGFRFGLLVRAYEAAFRDHVSLTDEAMAVERLGETVVAVPGSPRNRKITTPDDLAWAEGELSKDGGRAMTTEGRGPAFRVGSGFDAHRLVPGRRLVLGGVEVPFDRGLEGHSDGDCLLHAVCDALLGAAAAGELGIHFPSADPRWKGASSLSFLEEVVRVVGQTGYAVENLDVTVIAEQPRLAPRVEAIRAKLGEALRIGLDQVSVKAKSADGLGALGREEGIAAQATVLLRRKG